MSARSGEIPLSNGHAFKWMLGGETIPEIFGWIEKNYVILKGSSGWYRTPDPQKAADNAALSFAADIQEAS